MIDWLFGTAIGAIGYFAVARLLALRKATSGGGEAAPAPTTSTPPAGATARVQELADALRPLYEASSHPQDLLAMAPFQEGVRVMSDAAVPLEYVVNTCVGANHPAAAMAAEALAHRPDSAVCIGRVVPYLEHANVWTAYYILRFLQARAEKPVVGDVLVAAADWWPRNPIMPQIASEFIDARIAAGEEPDLLTAIEAHPPADMDDLLGVLRCLTSPASQRLQQQLADWQRARIDVPYLNSVGRVWTPASAAGVIADERLAVPLATALEWVRASPPLSLLVVGEPGAGKTSLIRLLAARLIDEGGTVFEASAADVISGQTYMGELENRIRQLLAQLDAHKRIAWYAPQFHELFYAGRHRYSPVGVLDLLLPAVEAGRVCLIGESEPAALEKVVQQRPRLRMAFKTVTVDPATTAQALDLAGRLARDVFAPAGVSVSQDVVREAHELARHYFAGRAQPGASIDLLRGTTGRLLAPGSRSAVMTREEVLATLGQLTGLPRSVLDERTGLDPVGLRAFFAQRVLGQPEAVDCLVDRVAMLKAGLTDPARPIGVFFFAGPTGTGKTEVAKTLAEFLFGSTERMIRLDMSEFQEPSSLPRLIGEVGEGPDANALVSRIRRQPFSVVLLDELEKANPRVWDLFLQVFDDGRLTDAQGNTADFSHAIIIVTSNVGGTEHQGSSLGFTRGGGAFGEAQVQRAIAQTFRPELVNRLDRVVVFRPLTKAVMRDILKKELRGVLQRRGLRSREWAVEWEESAVEFLLQRGFTPDMGARPLRRAIDQHLLAPLAMTIVEHRFPHGDQFLFLRSDGRSIQVEFVDPDAPSAPVEAPPAAEPAPASLSQRGLVLSAAGTVAERQFLEQELDALDAMLAAPRWTEAKRALYERMAASGFWDGADRHDVLARIELTDRIEAGAQTARSLLRRLGTGAQRSSVPRRLVQNLAQQLYLLNGALGDLEQSGCCDAFLSVEAAAAEPRSTAPPAEWAQRVASMYEAWARRRHMRATALGAGNSRVLAVSGLGALDILRREAGLHVLETPDADGSYSRITARVRVAAQPARRPAPQSELQQALECLAAAGASSAIVRRYREQPSPLVRDATGWRTGRLDEVLGGNFDLFTG
jgi:ATP-dependent Clp protease ATP-binding subunit ClpC